MRNERTNWREALLARHRESELLIDSETSTPSKNDPVWDSAIRKQKLDLMRHFDPEARLDEELAVRLIGDSAISSALPIDWITLLRPLQACVNEFSEKEVKLELSEFSHGSTVIHFRAMGAIESDSVAGAPIDQTHLASAVNALLKMVSDADACGDMRAWKTHICPFERLVDELEELDLTADFRWLARTGDVNSARLSKDGIQYVRALRESREIERSQVIGGRITELRESGHVKVKAGMKKNSTAWDVKFDSNHLKNMKLTLGEQVHWRVRQVVSEDRLHREDTLRWEFIEVAHEESFIVTMPEEGREAR